MDNYKTTTTTTTLDFFNFGPDIKQWSLTFHENANAYVQVNGQYSSRFNIHKERDRGNHYLLIHT